jgi:hypothetical protein
MYVCIHVCVYVCTYVYICTYICYVYMYEAPDWVCVGQTALRQKVVRSPSLTLLFLRRNMTRHNIRYHNIHAQTKNIIHEWQRINNIYYYCSDKQTSMQASKQARNKAIKQSRLVSAYIPGSKLDIHWPVSSSHLQSPQTVCKQISSCIDKQSDRYSIKV